MFDRKKWQQKYRHTEKGKLSQRKYQQSEKGKSAQKKYAQTEHGKEIRNNNIRQYRKTKRSKIMWKKYYEKNKYYLNILSKNWRTINRKRYNELLRKSKIKRRKMGFNILYENPFHGNMKIDYHHINNNDVVAIPSEIHKLYSNHNVSNHRINLNYIIKQIY
jgi:hypothetical protein